MSLETIKAFQLEYKYSKDEIIDLYFNRVYFGKNLRGIRTAGLYYFGKEVEKLNQAELLYLLTILRGPNYYVKRPDLSSKRYKFISDSLFQKKLISKSRNQKNIRTKLDIQKNKLHNIKSVSIPFISEQTNSNKKSILSTIEIKTQRFAKQFVSEPLLESRRRCTVLAQLELRRRL